MTGYVMLLYDKVLLYPTGRVGISQPAKKNGRCVKRREE
jgi:hypothetical protein